MPNELAVFKKELTSREGALTAVLGNKAKFDQFMAMAAALVGANPRWLQRDHDRNSLFTACMHAAESKLSLDPNLGHIYFVPRRVKGVWHIFFQVGYRGYMELAFRSGHFIAFNAEPVYEGDKFEYEEGTSPFVRHVRALRPAGNRRLIGAWARAVPRVMTAESPFKVITAEEVETAKKLSASGSGGFSPWSKFYEDMVRKTAVRRLAKFLHLATDLQRVVGLEDKIEVEFLKDARPTDAKQSLLDLARANQPKLADGGSADSAPSEPSPEGAADPAGDSAECAGAPAGEDLSFDGPIPEEG